MASWNEQLTMYFTNLKRAHPELTEGCEVPVMVAEVEHMDLATMLDWLEISGDDFARMLSGECVKLRRFCEAPFFETEPLYAELYGSWLPGQNVVDHISDMMDLNVNEVLQTIERAAS